MGPSENAFIVYGLIDPRDSRLRYVGITSRRLDQRINHHLSHTGRTHRGNWVESMKRAGVRPEAVVIERCDSWEALVASEKVWISYYLRAGVCLTNSTDGGEGMPGFRHTQEVKNHLSKINTGKKHSEASRLKISKAGIGRICTPETRAKMSAARKGKPHSPEHNLAVSRGRRGSKCSPEARARLSLARKGKPQSLKQKEAIAEGKRKARLRREEAQKCP